MIEKLNKTKPTLAYVLVTTSYILFTAFTCFVTGIAAYGTSYFAKVCFIDKQNIVWSFTWMLLIIAAYIGFLVFNYCALLIPGIHVEGLQGASELGEFPFLNILGYGLIAFSSYALVFQNYKLSWIIWMYIIGAILVEIYNNINWIAEIKKELK